MSRGSFALVVLLCGCSDSGVRALVPEPSATLINPSDQSTVEEGALVFISGTARDDALGVAVNAQLFVDDDPICEGLVVDADGALSCEWVAALPGGTGTERRIRLNVSAQGEAAEAVHTVTVNPSTAPTIVITSPTEAGEYYAADGTLPLTVEVGDPDQDADTLQVHWSDEDGNILPLYSEVMTGRGVHSAETDVLVDESGLTLTAHVVDQAGVSASDEVTITVYAENHAPGCAFLKPTADDIDLPLGVKDVGVPYELEVMDRESAAEDITVSLSLDKSNLYTGDATAGLTGAARLAVGEHHLEATVTDKPGLETTCEIRFTVCDAIWYIDSDGDGFGDPDTALATVSCTQPSGYVDNDSDCDDGEATTNPDAVEHCDGHDDDCDGEVDEDDAVDVLMWYADADGDAYGDPDTTDIDCDQPSGFVADDTDCDDTDATVNPGEVEICDGDDVDEDCDGSADDADAGVDGSTYSTWYLDDDGDGYGDSDSSTDKCDAPSGYVADSTDCDDADATVNPGEVEICDGDDVDEDCDGSADDADAGVDGSTYSTWYLDSDGDGYGDSDSSTDKCDAPSGYVADSTDCDDSAASTNPGAAEYCDDHDDDCDGEVDEDSAVDATVWYADSDGDSYGDHSVSDTECDQPSGYVADDDDCDDTDSSIHPGAEEVCDGVDEDCDGTADNDPLDGETFFADSDGDGFGDADSSALACTQPSGYSSDDADCDDDDADIHPEAEEVCDDGVDNDCDGFSDECLMGEISLADADVKFTGEAAGDAAGFAVTGAGDVNGDGIGDLLIGAPNHDSSSFSDVGAAYLVFGGTSLSDMGLGSANAIFDGYSSNGTLGDGLAGVGDVNGDGYDDILIGATGNNSTRGSTYLLLGPETGTRTLNSSTYGDGITNGQTSYEGLGDRIMGLPDLSGDGKDEIFIGSHGYSYATYGSAGCAYVIYGPGTGGKYIKSGDVQIYGLGDIGLGSGVAAGDIDGDGTNDLIVGAYGGGYTYSGEGIVYTFYGPLSTASATTYDNTDADLGWRGTATNEGLGSSLAAADFDGDGYDDLLIGASGSAVQEAYLVFGDSSPSSSMTMASADASFSNESSGDYGHAVVTSPGDIDDDDDPDLAFGAYGHDDPGTNTGRVALFYAASISTGSYGMEDADAELIGESSSDLAGISVAGAGDVNGDEIDDLLIGASQDDDAGSNAGAAYLIFGGW